MAGFRLGLAERVRGSAHPVLGYTPPGGKSVGTPVMIVH